MKFTLKFFGQARRKMQCWGA